jgi:hypothetical protein
VEERAACAVLKQRFQAAGFTIEDNRLFDEDGVRFEIDGFDAQHRVGYEYATEEAGDSWDVDDAVIAALEERRTRGELYVLIVREVDAPDAESLGNAADAFLTELRDRGVGPRGAAPHPEPAHPEPAHPEPAHPEPAHPERRHGEPAGNEPAPIESAEVVPAGSSGKPRTTPSAASKPKASKAKAPAKPKPPKKKRARK